MERIINIKIFKSGKIDMDTKHWGVQGEKNITKLLFTFPQELEEYNKEILFDFGMGKVVPDLIQNNQYTIDNNVSCYTNIDVAVRVTKQDGTKLFESLPEPITFDKSLEPTDDMPTPEDVSIYNTLINTLNEAIDGIEDIGISAVKEGTTTTLTITKADGTKEAYQVEDGKDYVITDEDKEEIVDTVKPMVKTDIQPILENIENIATEAKIIAEGKSESVVTDTWAEMEEWLKDVANKRTRKPGDNLYIKAKYTDETMTERQPDYWITEALDVPNDKGYYYNISELESDKPDLTGYAKEKQFETLTQAEYDALEEKSANTYYFIIEEE